MFEVTGSLSRHSASSPAHKERMEGILLYYLDLLPFHVAWTDTHFQLKTSEWAKGELSVCEAHPIALVSTRCESKYAVQ